MTRTAFNIALAILLLIPLQAVIFNHIVLFGVAMAFVFVYVIIYMPITVSTNMAMTVAFITGLGVDIFSDTAGLNALCCTLAAFVRKPVYHLYMSIDDDLGGMCPSARTMSTPSYLKFVLTMSLIYCATYFIIEAFQIFNLRLLLLRIIFSTVFTTVMIYAIDCLHLPKSNKK